MMATVSLEQLSLEQLNVSALTEADVSAIAARLEADEYTSTSDELHDWHLLRAIAFQRPELADPYFYLLDMEAYDEA
jgi:hypothetical protein